MIQGVLTKGETVKELIAVEKKVRIHNRKPNVAAAETNA
jgi:hypothetical protein